MRDLLTDGRPAVVIALMVVIIPMCGGLITTRIIRAFVSENSELWGGLLSALGIVPLVPLVEIVCWYVAINWCIKKIFRL